ncbi:MAG: hypothetical protein JWO66_247, partial [Candidatus Eremiobacteraeota bacterium]|nr:hypothetical protein [Candidatus Eremiobacteraeota bacterium]
MAARRFSLALLALLAAPAVARADDLSTVRAKVAG